MGYTDQVRISEEMDVKEGFKAVIHPGGLRHPPLTPSSPPTNLLAQTQENAHMLLAGCTNTNDKKHRKRLVQPTRRKDHKAGYPY